MRILRVLCASAVIFFSSEARAERWLAIAPDPLASALEPLAELRRSGGMEARVVRLSEVVPGADKSADAIRRWLAALSEGERPQFLLLVGDWSLDESADPAWSLPCFYLPTLDDELGEQSTATDHPYADLAGDHRPELSVGRIPARSAEELSRIVEKIVAYETLSCGDWQRRIALIGGEGGFGEEADAYLELAFSKIVAEEVPPAFRMSITYAGPASPYFLPPSLMKGQALGELDEGPLLWTYVGHGSTTGFDHARWGGTSAPICGVEDLAALSGEARRSVFVSIACYNNHFDLAEGAPCMGEAMLAHSKGPVASIASTRISHPYANTFLARGLVRAIFEDGERRLGRVLDRAKLALDEPRDAMGMFIEGAASQLGVTPETQRRLLRDHYELYVLLGDPALALRMPERGLKLIARPRARAGEELRFNVRFDGETGTLWEVHVERDREGLKPRSKAWDPDQMDVAEAIREAHTSANLAQVPRMTVAGPETVALPEGDHGWRGAYSLPAWLEPGDYVLTVSVPAGTRLLAGAARFTVGPPAPK